MPRDTAELRVELERLAAASAAALARLREGDETGVVALIERRESLLRSLPDCALEPDAAVMEGTRGAVALDAELVRALLAWHEGVGRDLARVTQARRALASYGASRSGSAVYVERFG